MEQVKNVKVPAAVLNSRNIAIVRYGMVIAILALLMLASAPPALAQLARGQGVTLGKADVERGLLGVDMTGFSPTFRISWRECITPQGETLYETPFGVQQGRLVVTPDGRACFSYADTDYTALSCYRVVRNGKGFIFNHDDDPMGGGTFVTTRVVTGVTSCEPDDDKIS
jgi:hypothetical protein